MRTTRIINSILTLLLGVGLIAAPSSAQAPAAKAPAKATAAKASTKAASATASRVPAATLAQLMKGIFFTNSNLVFFAQGNDPAKVAPAKDPALATDPLANAYGKWEAVENGSLAIVEAASLLTVPGRKCSNGQAVPIQNADWAKLVQGVRAAGLEAYKAAQAKDMDKILDAAGTMTEACANCHDKYREKATIADRCK